MSGFVQVIEWSTRRYDEVEALQLEWRARFPVSGPSRISVCKERGSDTRYLTVVEFESYEAAMRNSQDPSTSEFAARMQELCDGPPVFHDLDVLHHEVRMEAGARQPAR